MKERIVVEYREVGKIAGLLGCSREMEMCIRDSYGAYLAGPHAFEKPLIVDLKEQKVPAWIRLYCLYPLNARHVVVPLTWGEYWVCLLYTSS